MSLRGETFGRVRIPFVFYPRGNLSLDTEEITTSQAPRNDKHAMSLRANVNERGNLSLDNNEITTGVKPEGILACSKVPFRKDIVSKRLTQKTAFTLSEVLITLGIIGVVAAITIPSLIANTQKRQYITKFKKTISTLSNAARLSSELYGFDFAGINAPCNADSGSDNPENKQTVCAMLNGTLKGMTFYYGFNNLNDYTMHSDFFDFTPSFSSYKIKMPIYSLSDGTMIFFSGFLGAHYISGKEVHYTKPIGGSATLDEEGLHGTGCYAIIDVNGFAPPNKETTCTFGRNNDLVQDAGNCIVNNKNIGDIFRSRYTTALPNL